MAMIRNRLYEKYRAELGPLLQEDLLTAEQFEEVIGTRLDKMPRILIDEPWGQGVLHYFTYEEDDLQVCVVPVYGYYASSEKVLVQLFTRLSGALTAQMDTQFQIHLYAGDQLAQRTFGLLQFGYMAETGILKTVLPCPQTLPGICIRTLGKEEIAENWDEIWRLTGAILTHLQQAPICYPCGEFTQTEYRDFFLEESTRLHGAFDSIGRMVGMIETNEEANRLISANSANIGEVYVTPEYRGTGLSDALLAYAQNCTGMQGAKVLWVEHGTANRNARRFWGRYFDSYEYEMDRTIRKITL